MNLAHTSASFDRPAMVLPIAPACDAPATRILIADGHEIVRVGLRSILEAKAGWKVVAEAADGRDIVSSALASKPDVAILDASMPVINGIAAARQLRQRAPHIQVLIFALHHNETLVGEALDAGARGYLLKSEASNHLVSAVMALTALTPVRSDVACAQSRAASFVTPGRCSAPLLTPRQRMIVHLVAEGHSNKEIAAVLNLSIKTIEAHRWATMQKLKVTSIAGVVRYAIRNKLIEP